MSKNTEATQNPEKSQPAYVGELLLNGSIILEAPTREALADMVNDIPADCKYGVGAVGRKQDGSAYTLQVDIIKT